MIRKFVLRDKNKKLSLAFAHEIFLSPYITEKSVQLREEKKLVLEVAMHANKIDIKRAFEEIFEVPVESVNTLISKPRARNFKGKIGTRSHFKRAIIKVKKDVDLNKMSGVKV
jgi:large subunit ribosomal protein L23